MVLRLVFALTGVRFDFFPRASLDLLRAVPRAVARPFPFMFARFLRLAMLPDGVARSRALVTGGARGIGRATARLLAKRGSAVCVNYATHAEAAEGLAAEIIATGGRSIAAMADVAEAAAVEAMVDRIEKEMGPLTILVNNAGLSWRGP